MMLLLICLLAQENTWRFTEVSDSAGLSFEHAYQGESENRFIAGGVAAGDVNGDGWPDLYLVSGFHGKNGLYVNQGDGTFLDLAGPAGLDLEGRFGCGPVFVDYNGDGSLDLFIGGIMGFSPILFKNKGDGTFEDVTVQSGLIMEGDTFSAAFADTDRDGDLDLFTTHWQTQNRNNFWRNNGDGTFSNLTDQVGFEPYFRPDTGFTPNFADINNDLWPDLLVAADYGKSKVFLNDGTGHFIDATTPVISDENGMGAAVADYDNDGDLDWFVTSIGSKQQKRGRTGNRLYKNQGDGKFVDVTDQAGVREGFWGWGASFGDFDNDGHQDLFHVNGFLGPFAGDYGADPSRFFHADGNGAFVERSAQLGLNDTGQGRGLVCFDFDRDGDLDILIANNQGPVRLYRNDGGNTNGFLNIQIMGHALNSQAVGARVELTANGQTQMRHIRVGGNFVSQDPPIAHFGLGDASQAHLKVTWPDGLILERDLDTLNKNLKIQRPVVVNPSCETSSALWMPHVTRPGGGFETRFLLQNFASHSAIIQLQAYNELGGHLGNFPITLPAQSRKEMSAEDLFGASEVSHFAVYGPQTVVVSTGFAATAPDAVWAYVQQTERDEREWQFQLSTSDSVFNGLAIVNVSDQLASIHAEILAHDGAVSQTIVINPGLATLGKSLYVFQDLPETPGGVAVRVIADQNCRAILLRGTKPGVTPGLLFQANPTPAPTLVELGEKER